MPAGPFFVGDEEDMQGDEWRDLLVDSETMLTQRIHSACDRSDQLKWSRRFKLGCGLAVMLLGAAALRGLVAPEDGVEPREGRRQVVGLREAPASALSHQDCQELVRQARAKGLPDENPCEAGERVADLEAEMKSLEKQQEKLKKAAEVSAFQAKIERGECSGGLDSCNATKCCNASGATCYTQTKGGYAQCRQTCKKGKDPTHWDSAPWDCEPLGQRTPGEDVCVAAGENCTASRCCKGVGLQCYQKNGTYASCKVDCVAGSPDMSHEDGRPWTCKELGRRALSTAGWVWDACAKGKENCGAKQCCSEAGMQCYAQQENGAEVFWGLCKEECDSGRDPRKPWEEPWSCDEVGARTPVAPRKGGKVEKWALEKGACSGGADSCLDTRCCLGVDVQCYEKNETYAQCRLWCEPGEGAVNDTWTCKELSTRSWGLATKGWPSLFCFSLIRAHGYEMGILKHQYAKQIGIFECDAAEVLSADGVVKVGPGLMTTKVEPAEITTSQDGTAGNSKLFFNVWKAIVDAGKFHNYAWTIKVDPDAVIMPERMRHHMATYTGQNVFVVNCNKFTNSPNFPMMYGAVEIFSHKAMEAYAAKQDVCLKDMGMMMPKWGEDYYMTHCMDHIGVSRVGDWFSLGDQLCMGADCADPRSASYHPFKDLASWRECHDKAVASEPR